VIPVLFSLVALATACVALMPRSRGRVWQLSVLLCVATPPVVLTVACLLSGGRTPNTDEAFWFCFMTDSHVLLMLGALLSFRGLYYRLTRRASAPIAGMARGNTAPPVAALPAEPPAP
jgi:hypothetical protein